MRIQGRSSSWLEGGGLEMKKFRHPSIELRIRHVEVVEGDLAIVSEHD